MPTNHQRESARILSIQKTAYLDAGLPARHAEHIPYWHRAGYTVSDIAPYFAIRELPDSQYVNIPTFLRDRITPDTVAAFLRAGVTQAEDITTLVSRGCPPSVAAAWLAPIRDGRIPEDNVRFTSRFAYAYERATDLTSRTDLVNAFFLAAPNTPNGRSQTGLIWSALTLWTTGSESYSHNMDRATLSTLRDLLDRVPAIQIAALHHAGYTPAEVLADPALETADKATLATLARLRNTTP